MNKLCIRITHHGFSEEGQLRKAYDYINSICDRGFSGTHKTEHPHSHMYIETSKTAQQVRTQISKIKGKGSDRVYSVSELREELFRYVSYVMFKPETTERFWWGDFAKEIEMAKEYSSVQTQKKQKKAVDWFEEVRKGCYYDIHSTTEENFNTLYDFLIDRSYVNQFTHAKVQSMFYVWRAQATKVSDPEAYAKHRKEYFNRIL